MSAVIVLLVVLQLVVWLFTATGADGGFVCGVYTCVLLAFWGTIGLLWKLGFAGDRSLGTIVLASGWLPPVGCGIWLLWLMRIL